MARASATRSTATFNEADEETAVGTTTYSYDTDGNETGSSAGEARSYNAKNQTISITGVGGTLTPIGYEDAGQGERTVAGSSAYVNSAQGVASETKGGATVYYTRTPGGKLVSQRTPTATYYYLFDGQGSVIGLVDAVGNVVASYSYDPYGQTVVKSGVAADGNPWRYTGAYLDATGLYKMGQRYYDAARGRFTQRDPLGGGYVYAYDNPVNFVDPSGLISIDIGINVNISIGVVQFNGSVGVAVAYSPDQGVTAGATLSGNAEFSVPVNFGVNTGVDVQFSDAEQVHDLAGPFTFVAGGGGDIVPRVSGDYFTGDSPDGKVHGVDIIFGLGADTSVGNIGYGGGGTIVIP